MEAAADPFAEFLRVIASLTEQLILLTLDLLCVGLLLSSLVVPLRLHSALFTTFTSREQFRQAALCNFLASLGDLIGIPCVARPHIHSVMS